MAFLDIDGVGKVEVGDEFTSLTPEQQSAEVEHIAASLGSLKATPPPASEMTWGDVVKGAVTSAPASALKFGHDLVQPIIHPIDTGTAIKNVGQGVLQKIGLLSGDDHEKYADAVGNFFAERYGSVEGVKKAIATDPVGVLADISTVLTAGGSALARAPGVIGKVGEVAAGAGRVLDPLTVAGKVVKGAANVAAEVVGGTAGVGGKALRLAGEAGAEGGEAGRAFLENIGGSAPMEQVVADARNAVGQLRAERGSAYREGMKDIAADTTVLDFSKIDAALAKTDAVKMFKGQDLSPKTAGIRAEIAKEIGEWKALDPKDFHTAEGIDALKQKIGDIRDATQYGTPERVVANGAYNAIRQTIVEQAPKYAEVMKGYEEASNVIQEIEKTLSTKPGASIDASMRKLQSILRNNVSTNYGNRAALADYLVAAGAPNLLTKLAGQSLNTWMPRGIGKAIAGGEALTLPALALGNPATAGALAATLPLTSPKLMGYGAYGAGMLGTGRVPFTSARVPLRTIGQSAFQAGRLPSPQ